MGGSVPPTVGVYGGCVRPCGVRAGVRSGAAPARDPGPAPGPEGPGMGRVPGAEGREADPVGVPEAGPASEEAAGPGAAPVRGRGSAVAVGAAGPAPGWAPARGPAGWDGGSGSSWRPPAGRSTRTLDCSPLVLPAYPAPVPPVTRRRQDEHATGTASSEQSGMRGGPLPRGVRQSGAGCGGLVAVAFGPPDDVRTQRGRGDAPGARWRTARAPASPRCPAPRARAPRPCAREPARTGDGRGRSTRRVPPLHRHRSPRDGPPPGRRGSRCPSSARSRPAGPLRPTRPAGSAAGRIPAPARRGRHRVPRYGCRRPRARHAAGTPAPRRRSSGRS